MKIKLRYYSWSDNEVTGYDSDSSEKIVPLQLGIVEECKYFMVTEIRESSVMVAKKDGSHVSLGTYSKWPADLHEQGFGEPQEIFVGGEGAAIGSSSSYNGNERGSSQTLYLIDG